MNATTSEIECPSCKTRLAIHGLGHFTCPKCGQKIEVAPAYQLPQELLRVKKLSINNGLGWWTAVKVAAWLIFILPAGFLLLSAVLGVSMSTDPKIAEGGVLMALLAGIPGLILGVIGFGLFNWARSGEVTLICGQCRNPTNKHAAMCAACRSEFS